MVYIFNAVEKGVILKNMLGKIDLKIFKKLMLCILMSQVATDNSISFSSQSPDTKIAPIVIGGAAFVGKAIVGGAIGAAASWGTTRILDNRFPARK